MNYRVEFWVNESGGRSALNLVKKVEIIESDKLTEEELTRDFKLKLSSLYNVSQSEIKIGSFAEY